MGLTGLKCWRWVEYSHFQNDVDGITCACVRWVLTSLLVFLKNNEAPPIVCGRSLVLAILRFASANCATPGLRFGSANRASVARLLGRWVLRIDKSPSRRLPRIEPRPERWG